MEKRNPPESGEAPVQHEARCLPTWAEWLRENGDASAADLVLEAERRQRPPDLAPEPPEPRNHLGWGPASDSLYRLLKDRLDPDRDDHWTSQGLPRLDVVSSLAGRLVERPELTDVLPGWSRARARRARMEAKGEAILEAVTAEPEIDPALASHQRLLERAAKARAERDALGPFASFFPLPDLRCPLERRIAAENRHAQVLRNRRQR